MGCGNSFETVYKTEQFQEWMKQFEAMQLTKNEIRTMFKIFSRVDFDKSGSIALAELLAHIDLDRTRFTERIFSIFDADGSGEIDFREFVLSLWNYCTLTKATLDMFAFDLYDKDGSGELSAKEVTHMLQDIYGKNDYKTNFLAKSVANDLAAIEKSGKTFNIEEYRLFVRTHQALLFPAFQMQLALQRKVLGVRFWENNANKRLKFSNGKYISVGNFILMNVDASKKAVLDSQSPIALAMGGHSHKNDMEVGKMMELAGTKASRKKNVEENVNRGATLSSTGAELFSIQQMTLNTTIPMTEKSKKEWIASIVTMPALFNATSGSGKASPINPKKIQVGSTKGANTGTGNSAAPAMDLTATTTNQVTAEKSRKSIHGGKGDNTGTVPPLDTPSTRRKSFSNEDSVGGAGLEAGIATAGDKVRGSIKAGALRGSTRELANHANSGIEATTQQTPGMFNHTAASTKHNGALAASGSTATGNIPSGKIKNSALTLSAIKQIDQVSPIEAWEKQPTVASLQSRKMETMGFSTKSSKIKVRPSFDEADADTLGAEADFTASTRKSNRKASVADLSSVAYAALANNFAANGAAAHTGTVSAGESIKGSTSTKKVSRRMSIA